MPPGPGFVQRIWYKWKSLNLPWRRQFLVGSDLGGNTFWEFKDNINAHRFRRIVKYSGGRATHYADVKISPQWHQWLRHTRDEAPTLQEQQYEVARQARMKQLAAEADERWNSVPSFLDKPQQSQPAPAIGVKDPGGYTGQTKPNEQEGVRSAVEVEEGEIGAMAKEGTAWAKVEGKDGKKQKQDAPWGAPKGGPSEGWQPDTWSPGAARRR